MFLTHPALLEDINYVNFIWVVKLSCVMYIFLIKKIMFFFNVEICVLICGFGFCIAGFEGVEIIEV